MVAAPAAPHGGLGAPYPWIPRRTLPRMAARGWPTSILTAIGVAAGAGAAQLGLGYGLGIITWTSARDAAGETAWLTSLTWVLWLAAVSTVVGALCADRLGAPDAGGSTVDAPTPNRVATLVEIAWRVVIALSAAIGALVTVPLVAIPARAAHRADTFVPQITAGAYSVVGVIVGLVVAIAALSARAVAANVVGSACWLWALAVASVAETVQSTAGTGTARLAFWQFTSAVPWRGLYVPGAMLMLVAALGIGALAAWPGGLRGDGRVGVAISGAVGPMLVAAAYVLAGPRLSGTATEQQTAYVIAPWALLAGLAGSVVVAALVGRPARPARVPRPAPRPTASSPSVDDGTLTDWTQELSTVDERHPVDSRDDELEDDAYTAVRAYDADRSAYASDSGDDIAAAARPAPTATGRAQVKEPLWPAPAAPERKGRGKS
jgi:hypothetical protein